MNACYSCLEYYILILMTTSCLRLINCNDCGHTTNNDSVCIDWFLHLEDSSNLQTISGMLQQLMNPRKEYLKNYR